MGFNSPEKIVVLGTTLFPIRVILMIICFIFIYISSSIGFAFFDTKAKKGESPPPKAALPFQLFSRFLARVLLFCFGTFSLQNPINFKGYIWITVEGTPAEPSDAPVLVANHRSWIDSLWFYYHRGTSFVAKGNWEPGKNLLLGEIENVPIVGKIGKSQQVIFIKREGSAKANMVELIANRIHKITEHKGYRPIVIFPEGTTTNGQCLITYKRGAFAAGATVQPVLLQYNFTHYDPSWVPAGPSSGFLMFRMCCQFVNHLKVTYLPPVVPSEAEQADSVLYANTGTSK